MLFSRTPSLDADCVWILDDLKHARTSLYQRLPHHVQFIPSHQVEQHLEAVFSGCSGNQTRTWVAELPTTTLKTQPPSSHRVLWCIESPACWYSYDDKMDVQFETNMPLLEQLLAQWGHCRLSISLCRWYAMFRYGLSRLVQLGLRVSVWIAEEFGRIPAHALQKGASPRKATLSSITFPVTLPAALRQLIQDAWICLQQLNQAPSQARFAEEHLKKTLRTLLLSKTRYVRDIPENTLLGPLTTKRELTQSPTINTSATSKPITEARQNKIGSTSATTDASSKCPGVAKYKKISSLI